MNIAANFGLVPCIVLILAIGNICAGEDDKIKLTPEQEHLLEEYRERLRDVQFHWSLRNFRNTTLSSTILAGRKFNVNEAVKATKWTMKWREDNKFDTILDEKILNQRDYPYYIVSDFDGRPVIIAKAGEWDIRRVVTSAKPDDMTRYLYQGMELVYHIMANTTETTEKDISRFNIILDLNGYNLRQHGCARCIVAFISWINLFETHARGSIRNLYLINVPRIFVPLLEIIVPFMSEPTRNALKIFGPRRNEWQGAVLKIIPKNQLHREYGGTLEKYTGIGTL